MSFTWIGMSWGVRARSAVTTSAVVGRGVDGRSLVPIASRSSMTAGSVCASANPSPARNSRLSCALIRSSSFSNSVSSRGSLRAPPGAASKVSTAESNRSRAAVRCPTANSDSPAAKSASARAMMALVGSSVSVTSGAPMPVNGRTGSGEGGGAATGRTCALQPTRRLVTTKTDSRRSGIIAWSKSQSPVFTQTVVWEG